MPAVISLLRAVNVGGTGKIRMESLRQIYESLGFSNVQTYIQSGNVVYQTRKGDLRALARRIEDAIERTAGFRPAVIQRNCAAMNEIILRSPFASRTDLNPSRLMVTFLAETPSAEAQAKVNAIKPDVEELHLLGSELYVYYPDGISKSKLAAGQLDRALKTPGTTRNWNTVLKLREMAQSLDAARPVRP